jgi:hypothetical protein
MEPDRGITLLALFTAAALAIVGGVWLCAVVDTWWVLVGVVTMDLALTSIVLIELARLLRESE